MYLAYLILKYTMNKLFKGCHYCAKLVSSTFHPLKAMLIL
jgi:hypothetical protein